MATVDGHRGTWWRTRSGRTWVGRSLAAGYLLSVTAAVAALAVIGDLFLSVWLAVIEAASVATIFFVVRRDEPPGPARTTRLGTPNDPGMPSGRR